MSIAERTREAVRQEPFLQDALRAGVLNYTEAARYLDIGDEQAVTAALRRYGKELRPREDQAVDARVSMESNLGRSEESSSLLRVGSAGYEPGEGNATAIVASGNVAARSLRAVLGRCETAEIPVDAAAVAGETLVVVVDRRDGPDALRAVEEMVTESDGEHARR